MTTTSTKPREHPAFDFDLAIAKMDSLAFDPSPATLDMLRGRYPELGFVFDAIEDQHEAIQSSTPNDEVEGVQEELDRNLADFREVAALLRRANAMLHTLAEMDSVAPVAPLIRAVVQVIDEAAGYTND